MPDSLFSDLKIYTKFQVFPNYQKTVFSLQFSVVAKYLYDQNIYVYSGSHSDAVQHYITSVGARHCRAPTGVPHVNENRYIFLFQYE
ncbi:MAG: hypothetical protein V7K90_18640 [Nostoc sp.]|uniref:hypothetical protein n=1 Tax=Nostoc sp. TaxID=1180 RepID=UPI002FF7A0D7